MSSPTDNLHKVIDYAQRFPGTIPSLDQPFELLRYDIKDTNDTYTDNIHDYKKCYANTGVNPSINMVLYDNNLRTVDECVSAAALQQNAFNNKYLNNNNCSGNGLQYKIYKGYSNNDAYFYKNATLVRSGTTSNLSDINSAVGGLNLAGSNDPFSVEWVGFFITDFTASWTFTVNSDSACQMWIGDVAINDYNNNNSVIDVLRGDVQYSSNFTKNVPYKIRIQYSSNGGSPKFSFSISDYSNVATHGEKYLTLNCNDKDMAYFALVENTPEDTASNRFNCYLTDTTKSGVVDQLNKSNSGYNLQMVWNASDKSGSSMTLSNSNYLLNDGANLAIHDQTGKIMLNLYTVPVPTTMSMTTPITTPTTTTGAVITNAMELVTFNGDIKVGSKSVTNNLATINSSEIKPLSSPLLKRIYTQYLNNNIDLSVINKGDILRCLQNDFTYETLSMPNLQNYLRLSADGKYVMFLNRKGDLVFYTNIKACPETNLNSSNLQYTTSSSKSFYPYSVNVEDTNSVAFTDYLIDHDNRIKNPIKTAFANSGVNIKSRGYTDHDGYYPLNTDATNPGACNPATCDNNPNCNYYYSYTTKNGTENCVYDYGNSVPVYKKRDPNEITKSALHVKQWGLDYSDPNGNPIKKGVVDNIKRWDTYNINGLDQSDLDNSLLFNNIYDKLTSDYYLALDLVDEMLLTGSSNASSKNQDLNGLLSRINSSTTQLETFTSNIREGFTTAKQTTAKNTTAKQTTAKQTTAKQTTAKQTTAKNTTAKQTTAKQTTPQNTTAKNTTAKQTTPQQTMAKQTTPQQTTAKQTTPQQTTPQQTTPQQTTAKQTMALQTTAKQTTPQQTTPQQTIDQQTIDQQTIDQQTIDQDNITDLPRATIGYESMQTYKQSLLPEHYQVTESGLVDDTINNKMLPMKQTAKEYSVVLDNIDHNYGDIINKVNVINNKTDYLKGNPRYDYADNMLMGEFYDENGNLITLRGDMDLGVKRLKSEESLRDAVIEDTSTMMYRENTVYILGSMTAAFLLITAVTLAR